MKTPHSQYDIYCTLLLSISKKILDEKSLYTKEQRRDIIKKSNLLNTIPPHISQLKKSQIDNFISILLGEHPIFLSKKFLLLNEYNPLDLDVYYANHRISEENNKSNIHGNNYIYSKINLRNGVLFTYHDIETMSYIPVTFNTNIPITMVAPDPFCVRGNIQETIQRMITDYHKIITENKLKSFPLIIKGINKNIANNLSAYTKSKLIEYERDVTTITAELNFPAFLYNIQHIKNLINQDTNPLIKATKIKKTVKKLDKLTTYDDWNFNEKEAKKFVYKWAKQKEIRSNKNGHNEIDINYLSSTVLPAIGTRPPGKQNLNYYAIAIRASINFHNIKANDLLGIVMAARSNKDIAALTSVVVPINKYYRNIGYYSVYKLVTYMSQYGIKAYWHGPKESQSDIDAIIEFFGAPYKKVKKYCLQCTL